MTLTVDNLSKTYGSQKALDRVSFSLKKGEIVGVLGPNGAGKSTLFKILTAYLKPDSGNAKILDFDILENPLEIKKNIGYLPENNPLYLDMYVTEFLGFLADLHQVSKDKITTLIKKVGLENEAHKKIGQLSKGYKQRVGLASALLHNPDVLLLDEPTTGLDPNQLIEIRNLITEIGKTKTVLFSSHILQEVAAICQRVLLINKGKLVADINLDDLKKTNLQHIEVTFDKSITESLLKEKLKIKTAKNTADNNWLLSFENTKDTGALLFDFAKDNGYKILQMQQKSENLEEFFKRFTS